ncbi:hypothetical protein EYF80_024524 [Liparis tanakae]|uniref:Uncharacterized protein n=1 Tax=Liparis tanakae TaxID=230148 RepID=A0A4Z2HJ07_9TELE|nr:hypothetical protein EYF80_024524 [Liparis tanakae]
MTYPSILIAIHPCSPTALWPSPTTPPKEDTYAALSNVPSLPFFLGGFFMGVFFGVGSNIGSPGLEPFKSCFSGLLASGVPRSLAPGVAILWRLLEVGSRGLGELCWLNPLDGFLLAFCGGVGFSRFPLGVESPLVFVRPVPSFLLMLWVFSLS